jgi:formylglycine-generating enzyme required for sulfatase activity
MAAALFDLASLAEIADDRTATEELSARLAAFDPDGRFVAAWRAPASLAIHAAGAAHIAVFGHALRGERLERGPAIATVDGERLIAQLPPGLYAIELRGRDGLLVRDQLLSARGERLALELPLPRAADVPPGMVYIPPGRFLTGDASGNDTLRRTFLLAPPLYTSTTGGYLIGIHEVTFAEWMTYLRALPPAERERHRPDVSSPNGASLKLDGGRRPDEPFRFTIKPSTLALTASEGEPLVYPGRTHRSHVRWEATPVAGISSEDAHAYVRWLSDTGRVPGARLCTQREWERGGRGADGRRYPHGDRLEPDDANTDMTYGRDPLGYGPDEVGSHPASTSPFGLADTSGNVWEWVESPLPNLSMLRGGCWYQNLASSDLSNRDINISTVRWLWAGMRVCATPR